MCAAGGVRRFFHPRLGIVFVADASRTRVFNFSVELARHGDTVVFFAATEEGFLWSGEVREDTLVALDRIGVSASLGVVVSLQPDIGILAVAGDHVHLFEIPSKNCCSRPVSVQKSPRAALDLCGSPPWGS